MRPRLPALAFAALCVPALSGGARWEPSANFAVGGGWSQAPRPAPRPDDAAAQEELDNGALLRRYPRSARFAGELGADFKPIGWSGDPQRIPERKAAVRALVHAVEDEHDEDPRKPVKLVCRGHGCGIALEALDELNDKGLRIARLVTMDAKLTRLFWQGKPDRPPNVKEWVHLFTGEQTRGDSDRQASEEARARAGRGIESFCVSGGLDGTALTAAAAELVRAEEPAQPFLRKRYAGGFAPSECPSPADRTTAAAKTPSARPAPASARAAAPQEPAAAEKPSLRGPRLLIQSAIELARRLARQTRAQVSEVRSEKLRKREELLAKKREEEERRRMLASQADQSYPWDPQSSWSAAAAGGTGAAASSGAGAAAGTYGGGAGTYGGPGGPTSGYRPTGAAGGALSAFPQGGVKPQMLQSNQPGGGP